jgi:hypothetical protein
MYPTHISQYLLIDIASNDANKPKTPSLVDLSSFDTDMSDVAGAKAADSGLQLVVCLFF